jgi:hypothetical protein
MPDQLNTDTDSLKSQTARANGAKSHGPVTPEGRAASSRNSLRHGFTAKSVVLPTESQEDFLALLDSYTDQFNPQGGVEMDLVQAMAAARWRLQRICNIEAALLSTELVRRAEDIDEEFENMKNVDRLAWVFEKLADHGQALSLIVRYEGALNRSYDRAFKQLHMLQSARRRAQPNEPKPAQAAPRDEPALEPVQNHTQPNEPNPFPAPALGSVPVASTVLPPASEHPNDPRVQKEEVPIDAG